MKAVLLDIDGVLLTKMDWADPAHDQTCKRYRWGTLSHRAAVQQIGFSQTAVQLLNRLCKHTQAKVVVISSWRWDYSKEELHAILVEQGVMPDHIHPDIACPVVARLNTQHRGKKEDAEAWLKAHSDVSRVVVLDDDAQKEGFLEDLGIDPWEGFGMRAYRIASWMLQDGPIDSEQTYISPSDCDQLAKGGLSLHDYQVACWLESDRGAPRSSPASVLRRPTGGSSAATDAKYAVFSAELASWMATLGLV